MAIVIPSKNIYSINFNPVIDNQIDKVEVSVNAFKEVKDFDTIIYSENYIDSNSVDNQGISNKNYEEYLWLGTGGSTIRNVRVATEIKGLQKAIILPKIYIPKNQNKKLITNTREAKISVSGEINHYTSGISLNTIYGDLSFGFDSVSGWVLQSKESSYDLFNAENYNNENFSVLYERDVASVLQNKLEEIQAIARDTKITATHRLLKTNKNGVINILSDMYIDNNGHASPDPVRAELRSLVSGTKKDISITIETHNGEECYAIKIERLLIELTVMFATGAIGWYKGIENISGGTYIENGATKIEFIPNKIDLSVYGDIITLDLQDETVTINNGNKVFSFDGNELIQSTNTPTQESKYQEIIEKWKDGKQTVIISCPISDYYDENGRLSIPNYAFDNPCRLGVYKYINKSTYGVYFLRNRGASKPDISIGDKIYYQNESATLLTGLIPYLGTGSGVWKAEIEVIPNGAIAKEYNKNEIIVNLKTAGLLDKLIFNIGDIVIPYTYTNQGDKPLSYNKDFTPKQFKVVGTSISKKQGVTQELTLQEI